MRDNETDFVGRIPELAMLERALTSAEAEMVATIGRRRVGKTYLIRRAYERHMVFEMTGLQHGAKRVQLRNFADQLRAYSGSSIPLETPHNWQAAFQLLIHHLESLVSSEKQLIFFDEVPWIATPRSDFLSAFGLFWNSWASRKSVVVVICGSAASWMINKVVKNRGGLYNRITKRVFLKPFNLAETEHFLVSRGVRMDHYQMLQVYMAMAASEPPVVAAPAETAELPLPPMGSRPNLMSQCSKYYLLVEVGGNPIPSPLSNKFHCKKCYTRPNG